MEVGASDAVSELASAPRSHRDGERRHQNSSRFLTVENDEDLMLVRDFEDRRVMLLLRMMKPYLKKPAFEQF